MPNLKMAAVTAALLLAVGAAAQAADQPKANGPRPEPLRFEAIDTNKDGFITLDEMKAGVANRPRILEHVDKLFARLDKNKDGKLSKEEFKNRHHRGHHGEKHENDEK